MVKGSLFLISVNNLFPKKLQWDKFTVELYVSNRPFQICALELNDLVYNEKGLQQQRLFRIRTV